MPCVQVDHTFTVSGVGTVVSGRLMAGTIIVGSHLMLGPLEEGSFSRVQVTGIQRAQVRPQLPFQAPVSMWGSTGQHVPGADQAGACWHLRTMLKADP